MLGILYRNGSGVTRDFAMAVRLYREAAAGGEARAMYLLGLCYRHGEGVLHDLRRARYWFTKAANAKGGDDENVTDARKALAEIGAK